ncbi:recombinase family protein [Streptomyces sp. PmtG]
MADQPAKKPAQWRAQTIEKMLTNPALMGWEMHCGKPVRDDAGNPVMATTSPIFSREEFDQVAALLTPKPIEQKAPERKDSTALLLRVDHCNGCGERMYLNRSSGTYRCSSYKYGTHCPAPCTVRAAWGDDYVTDEFLKAAGQIQINRVVEIPGYDPQPEIDATAAEFAEHPQEKGRQKSKTVKAEWQRRADALDARLAELESREKREPRREVVPTGRTYADDWNEGDASTYDGWSSPSRESWTPPLPSLRPSQETRKQKRATTRPRLRAARPEPVHALAEPATSPARVRPEPEPAPAEPARELVAA